MSNLSLFKSQLLSKQEYINENKQTEKLAEQLLPSLNQFETSRCQVYGKGVEGSFCSCAYRTRGCTKSAQRSRCNQQLLPPLLWGQGAGLQLRFQWLLWLFAMGNDKTIVSLRTQFGAHGKVPAEAG